VEEEWGIDGFTASVYWVWRLEPLREWRLAVVDYDTQLIANGTLRPFQITGRAVVSLPCSALPLRLETIDIAAH